LSTATHDALPRSSDEPARSNPRAAQMLSRIWLAAQAVWGHKWTSTRGDLPIDDHGQLTVAGQLWANGLRGITERQVLDAFDRLTKLGTEWPPNLPELRKAAAGIPSFDEINHELLTTDTAHRSAFARLTWSFVDGYQHRHARAEDAKRMRREAYERAAEHVLQGGALPGPVAGEIEHQGQLIPQGIPTDRQARIDHLRGVLAKDGVVMNEAAASRTIDELNTSEARREAHRVPRIEDLS